MALYGKVTSILGSWNSFWLASNHPNLDNFSIETHGFGIPHIKNPPNGELSIAMFHDQKVLSL